MTTVTDTLLTHLATRRSVKPEYLTGPGMTPGQLNQLLTIASRTPDHGKLAPWRFIIIGDDQRENFAREIKVAACDHYNEPSQQTLAREVEKFLHAPTIVVLIHCPKPSQKIPAWEQDLAVGAVGMNLLHTAIAMGFTGQWLTNWYSYHDHVNATLGLSETEQVAGYFYFGHSVETPEDRPRPDIDAITTHWSPPS